MYIQFCRKIVICIFLLYLSVLFFSSCNDAKKAESGFVYMEGKDFKLSGKDFYPIILNYSSLLKADSNDLWVGPNIAYEDKDPYTKKAGNLRFKADMQMIKDLGFNTVRLVGIGEYGIDNNIAGKRANTTDSLTKYVAFEGKSLDKYFEALSDMFNILNEVGIKAIVLINSFPDENAVSEKYWAALLSRFKNEKAILAWDYFNEPLYFDAKERKKENVYRIVKKWKKTRGECDPNHLFTIGLTGTREVFEWDPNILDVDFLSIHPYEFHKGEVENEITWYGRYVKTPWIIGETGFSADNDSISYDVQKMYTEKFIQHAINCGASGFSWWQYKDVEWHQFQSNFLGLLNNKGTTKTSNKDLIVNGTVKPAGYVFKEFNPNKKTGECSCRDNYYNYDGLNQFAVKGKLIDRKTGQPIVGGNVVVWNQYYGESNLTFTKEDGSFIVYGNFKIYHFIASSTLMSFYRANFDWDGIKITTENGVPTYDIGTIKLSPLQIGLP
ncbi:MAG TPA: cellulase family glycosylhydrolase [Bacteroidia bacterium]|nr:cellulase family glycosylhydrolase [Bacteroidia bacterium]